MVSEQYSRSPAAAQLEHVLRTLARELILWLLQQGHQPVHLKPGSSDVLIPGVQEAIELRQSGNVALSLELLDRLQATGLDHPLIADNRAQAELALGNISAAASIWRSLLNTPDEPIAAIAHQMLTQLQRQLLEGLQSHCSFHSWPPRHLPSPDELSSADILQRTLEEAIASREAGHPGVSLALVEEALLQGWRSPWLLDHRARALLDLERADEAKKVWQELCTSSDAHAAASAAKELNQLEKQLRLEALATQCRYQIDAGQFKQAEATLLGVLVAEPDQRTLLKLLEETISQQEPVTEHDSLNQELAEFNLRLAIQEKILEKLEQRQ